MHYLQWAGVIGGLLFLLAAAFMGSMSVYWTWKERKPHVFREWPKTEDTCAFCMKPRRASVHFKKVEP